MATPEPSGHTMGRLDHPNLQEAEKNDFKGNFMQINETFKEEMKNSHQEMDKQNFGRNQ